MPSPARDRDHRRGPGTSPGVRRHPCLPHPRGAGERRLLGAVLALSLGPILLSGALGAQEIGTLLGRVVDDGSREPIAGVIVHVETTPLSAVTGNDGRFAIDSVPPGTYVLRFEHLRYGERLSSAVVRAGQESLIQIRMVSRPIQLDSVVVSVPTELDERRRSTGAAMHEILRPQIDEAARRGQSLGDLLRDQMPALRVEQRSQGFLNCVEFRGGTGIGDGSCKMMAIFVDGLYMSAPGTIPPNMPLNDIERVEAISPGQAGVQWGTLGGYGVLLIETRQGPAPDRMQPPEDLMFGFDWSQEWQPYPWTRVLGSSFLVNAAGLGIGMWLARGCLEVEDGALGIRECGPIRTIASGTIALGLPILGTSYAARWGGSTQRSRGRIVPAAVLGSISSMVGYLLLIEGNDTVGGTLLVVGTPLLAALSDRIFRVLR